MMIYLDLKLNLEIIRKRNSILRISFIAFYLYIYFIFTSCYHVQYNLIKKNLNEIRLNFNNLTFAI